MSGILNLKNESWRIVLILIPLVCLSNFAAFWTSYIFTVPILKFGILTISELSQENGLPPAWSVYICKLVSNDIALLSGLTFGIAGNFIKLKFIDTISQKLLLVSNFILKKVICLILPLFILGFIIKMQHEGALTLVIKEYSKLLLLVAILSYGYMFSAIYFLCGRRISMAIEKFKNLIPGILIGFFGMSSIAALPTTIEGCQKNLKDKNIASFVVPAAANMHLLGDCFALPIIGLALMVSFGYGIPSVQQFLVFSIYGVVAKFAAAGIPGGSAIIFAPLFENVFGFSAPMLTAVTAIYVLFDPVATSANVFGHGMFAIFFEKVSAKILRKSKLR
jgi:Na+/H+-dicarboxylate symporter